MSFSRPRRFTFADLEVPLSTERATLESKDRAELIVIAQSMGLKVGSRARKATIVNMILDGPEDPADNAGSSAQDNRNGSAQRQNAQTRTAEGNTDSQNGARTSQANADDPNRRRRRRRGRDRDEMSWEGDPLGVNGYLDLRSDGYGFLRVDGPIPNRDDCYVPVKMVREFGLRSGDHIAGTSRPAARNEKNPALLTIDSVNGRDPQESLERPRFEDLVAIYPNEPLKLVGNTKDDSKEARIIDLVAPIGKGQRALIVAPPRSETTNLVKELVRAIETHNPDVKMIVLLIDERPEEVTDMASWVSGEVIASPFDRSTDEHIAHAEVVSDRARRMVESGDDVCIVVDSLTRLVRAYQASGRFSGRAMPGGVDAGALYPVKRLFGSARNVKEAGSLTIIATALDKSESTMDTAIRDEFARSASMEVRISRDCRDEGLFPAIDIAATSTHHDSLLRSEAKSTAVSTIRRKVYHRDEGEVASPVEALRELLDQIENTTDNDALVKKYS